MKVTGIIAEYNPFHNGHKYQIEEARKKGADYIIVVMSGDFTQRGEAAIFDKYTRSRMALMNGADLVIELPAIFATADAGRFAEGGVSILDKLGLVNELIFGIEAGCEEFAFRLSDFLSNPPDSYTEKLRSEIKSGKSYPLARSSALSAYFSQKEIDLLTGSNMILALEYLQAIKSCKSSINPLPLTRIGAGYNDIKADIGGYSSASAVREIIRNEDSLGLLADNVPSNIVDLMEDNIPVFTEDLSPLLHYKLLTESDFTKYLDVEQSFSDRINSKKSEYVNIDSFADLLKSKNITRTSVMRLLMHILLNMKADVSTEVTYARILGFKKGSEPLLSEIKKNSAIPLISKLADATVNECLQADIQAADIYNSILTAKSGIAGRNEYNNGIVII